MSHRRRHWRKGLERTACSIAADGACGIPAGTIAQWRSASSDREAIAAASASHCLLKSFSRSLVRSSSRNRVPSLKNLLCFFHSYQPPCPRVRTVRTMGTGSIELVFSRSAAFSHASLPFVCHGFGDHVRAAQKWMMTTQTHDQEANSLRQTFHEFVTHSLPV